jgi:hypothetical protein
MTLELKEAKGVYLDSNQRIWVATDSVEHNGELRKGVPQVVLIETRNYSKVTSDFTLPESKADIEVNMAVDMETLEKRVADEFKALEERINKKLDGIAKELKSSKPKAKAKK